METRKSIDICLDKIEPGLKLSIDAVTEKTMFFSSDAAENGEAEVQIVEGFSYDYYLDNPEFSLEKNLIVSPHSRQKNTGTISPNIYVGTLSIPVIKNGQIVGDVKIEVQSIKAGYRSDYRDMLEFITEKCTGLLLQSGSPASHNFEADFNNDNETLYQKFAFVKSVIATDEFSESVHRIVSSPVTQWKETEELKDIRNIRRLKSSGIRELTARSNRTQLPNDHYLQRYGLNSLPDKITSVRKSDTADTPENRFIKFALESFMKFCSDINKRADKNSRLKKESEMLERELESYLHHSFFKEISRPDTLQLNSPVLQRKEGYREVLRVWLMFDLAAKLVWKGGEDVYSGGKKDIATLYEYWLFFKLLDLLQSVFSIEPKDVRELIKESDNGLNLQLKQGIETPLSGVFDAGTRKLMVKFCYNRTFKGKNTYPNAGSWTTEMRPDYTLSFWPDGITEEDAEKQELIVHIHFDAKYKIANLIEILNTEQSETPDEEKQNNRKGIYKNADLLKMHAYRDAIRRTGGAYVLYPGSLSLNKQGFHEILPGLGAFPVRPCKTDDGTSELRNFILEVVNHFINRASQREKIAYKAYDIYKDIPKKNDELNELLPEPYGENRGLIPDETYVIIGYCKTDNHLQWYMENGLYNFRMNDSEGSLILDEKTVKAKYLVLRINGKAEQVFSIKSKGPKVFSGSKLNEMNYPGAKEQEYLVIEIEGNPTDELGNTGWNFKQLKPYQELASSESNPRILAGIPFTVSLKELMKTKISNKGD